MARTGPLKVKIMLFCGEVTAIGPGEGNEGGLRLQAPGLRV